MNRSTFLSTLGALAVGGACASLLAALPGCGTAPQVQAEERDGALLVRKSDLAGLSHALLTAPGLPAPVYLSRNGDAMPLAVLLLCTHKRCALRVAGDLLLCPCHGSEFRADGRVLSPPATVDLRRFEVREDDTHFRILL
jgi:cytochrome b6-f complex iron-sulfur subunit